LPDGAEVVERCRSNQRLQTVQHSSTPATTRKERLGVRVRVKRLKVARAFMPRAA
jgi:hypothetical protein